MSAISFIVELRIRNQPPFLSRQINSQFVAKSLRNHVVFPDRNGVLRRTVFTVAKHTEQSPTEIGVARCSNSRNQWQGRSVSMAAYCQSSVMEPMWTRECRTLFSDDSFLQERQSLRCLERRSRRIHSHQGTIQKRFSHITLQSQMVLTTLAANHQMRVIIGRGYQTKDFSGLRFDSHNASNLIL